MTAPARIAIVAGDTPASRAVAHAVASLLGAVGRWVEEVRPDADLAPYAAVIVPRGTMCAAVRTRWAGPILVVDADLLGGAPHESFRCWTDGAAGRALDVRDTRVLLPRPLPGLAGRSLGAVPGRLAVEAGRRLGYMLPVVLTPALRTVRGFWNLVRVTEEAIAAVLEEARACYVDPWPAGFRAARALTCDLDGLESGAALAALAASGRRATLFCCADRLERLDARAASFEIAAHGDVHRSFADPRTNLARVDRMREAFRAAGLAPQGFSPPNLTYTSPLGPLLERFAYVRLGYQERELRFFPSAIGDGALVSVSHYPDLVQRYVGVEECSRLLAGFCTWAAQASVLAVPCFHPCLGEAPLRRFLGAPASDVWEATLAEVAAWWRHRGDACAALAGGAEASAPDVRVAVATPADRLAELTPPNGEPAAAPRSRRAIRVDVSGRGYWVVPAAAGPAAEVEVPLGPAWRALGWLPHAVERAVGRAWLEVTNKNGLHGCLYGDLGLVPYVAGGALRLPMVAPDEPVFVAGRHPGSWRRLARRWLARPERSAEVDSVG